MRIAAVPLGAVALVAAACGGRASLPTVADVVRNPADVPPPITGAIFDRVSTADRRAAATNEETVFAEPAGG